MNRPLREEGFGLIEVMVAMVISATALVGTMGAVELSARHMQQSRLSSKALEMAQARLEVKRSVRWECLLEDDLDHDGVPETIMKDDGQGSDEIAGDGVYSAAFEKDGVTLAWSVEVDHPGPLGSVGMVAIRAVSSYVAQGGRKEVRMATLRANPAFVGKR
jgi:prepilin-type N-terminal cleavage/methylation domain-containing protein